MRLFTNLTPLIPAPYQGEGRYCIKRGLASVKVSYPPNMGVFRGALAPQKINLPLPLIKGKGISPSQVKDKGDRVNKQTHMAKACIQW